MRISLGKCWRKRRVPQAIVTNLFTFITILVCSPSGDTIFSCNQSFGVINHVITS